MGDYRNLQDSIDTGPQSIFVGTQSENENLSSDIRLELEEFDTSIDVDESEFTAFIEVDSPEFSFGLDIPKGDGVQDVIVNGDSVVHAGIAYIDIGGLASVDIDRNTLTIENNVLRVNTTNDAEEDNSLPITSAGVHTIVGNIEALLGAI